MNKNYYNLAAAVEIYNKFLSVSSDVQAKSKFLLWIKSWMDIVIETSSGPLSASSPSNTNTISEIRNI